VDSSSRIVSPAGMPRGLGNPARRKEKYRQQATVGAMEQDQTIKLLSGNAMPVFGLGTWLLNLDTAGTVAHALEIGYRLIDTSSDYGSQPGIGAAIRESGIPREDIYLVTKVEENDDAYRRTVSNLAELGLDRADMMLIHRPPIRGAGEDLWEGLIRAQNEGLTRDIGVSNYSSELIEMLIAASGVTPAVNQIEWSPFGRSQYMQAYRREKGIVIMAYSPLTRTRRLTDGTLLQIAGRYHKSAAQILIRWSIQSGNVVIPKANQWQHLEENIDVFDFEIDAADMRRLDSLDERYSALGSLPYI
jgi:2,5-diketo-D-gluconate reductase A